jgi:hypothetical protein
MSGLERLLLELLGPYQISLRFQRLGQLEHRCQCVRVLLTQQTSTGLEHLLMELAGRAKISLHVQRPGQVVHRQAVVFGFGVCRPVIRKIRLTNCTADRDRGAVI